jgi:hypothetical protein
VGHHHGGELVLVADLHELLLQIPPGECIEGSEGFIKQQQLGLDGQSPGDGNPLAHAAGELERRLIGGVSEAHHVDVLLNHGIAFAWLEIWHHLIYSESDVFAHTEPGQQ